MRRCVHGRGRPCYMCRRQSAEVFPVPVDRLFQALAEVDLGLVADGLFRQGHVLQRVLNVAGAGGGVLRLDLRAQKVLEVGEYLVEARLAVTGDVDGLAPAGLGRGVHRQPVRLSLR